MHREPLRGTLPGVQGAFHCHEELPYFSAGRCVVGTCYRDDATSDSSKKMNEGTKGRCESERSSRRSHRLIRTRFMIYDSARLSLAVSFHLSCVSIADLRNAESTQSREVRRGEGGCKSNKPPARNVELTRTHDVQGNAAYKKGKWVEAIGEHITKILKSVKVNGILCRSLHHGYRTGARGSCTSSQPGTGVSQDTEVSSQRLLSREHLVD